MLYFTLGFIENLMTQFLNVPSSWFSLIGFFGIVSGIVYFKEAYKLRRSPDESKSRARVIRGFIAISIGLVVIFVTSSLFLKDFETPLWFYLLPLGGITLVLGTFKPRRG